MIPTRIGQTYNGGIFTGFTRIGNRAYSIIVAPKHTETRAQWKSNCKKSKLVRSVVDGRSNTATTANYKSSASKFCSELVVNGYADWYLPSLVELGLCYKYLKPATYSERWPNSEFFRRFDCIESEFRKCAIPSLQMNSFNSIPQTLVVSFQKSNPEQYSTLGYYWTSTSFSKMTSFVMGFHSGGISSFNRTTETNVRAVRCELATIKETQ